MKYLLYSLIGILMFVSCSSQNKEELRGKIEKIIQDKKATVGVALVVDGKDTLTINNSIHYPMQSVFKFHLALAVLDYMNINNIPLDHKVYIQKEDLLPDTWSPIREEHPDGNFEMPIGELIKYTVAKSDNNGCDILFRFIGGTEKVDSYIKSLGITDFSIVANEEEMHREWDLQYKNYTTPYAAIQLLEKFREENILPKHFHDFLWETMIGTTTGSNKIKGLLPDETIVAHKTGSSGRNEKGLKGADNDIAIIQLPDGRQYSLAIFVSDSYESDETNAEIISQISKIIYDDLITP
ncbi:MAG: class A beta-lactamase, subclass A2 [Prevotella sp.]|jgi:beta-lactamase class A|nr:class A beta-lactamase, subclass A2 [Prevotella sp.]